MSHRPLLRRFPHILLFCPACTALQIFVQSFVASQKSKDKHWLTQSCKDADSMRSANRMFGGWIERDGTRLPLSDKVEAGVRYVFVGGERLGTYFTVMFCSFLCLRLPCI
jgi:hypothetical protein